MKRLVLSLCSIFLVFCFLVGCSSDTPTDQKDADNSTTTDDNNSDNSNTDSDNLVTEENTEIITSRIFIFDTKTLTPYYINKDVTVTNDDFISALTKELQTNLGNDFLTLTDKVKVTSATKNDETGILKINFSDSYVSHMTLGSATESALLSMIVNTYAYNLNVDKVAIYFNNELYTGLRGELPEGYYKPYYDDSSEYVANNTADNSTTNDNDSTVPEDKIIPYRIFFYDGNLDSIFYSDEDLEVIGGGVVSALTNALKSPPSSSLASIPSNTGVTSANLDSDNGILTVNLSKDYYEILSSVGSSSEAGILNSLALTYGYNYNVNKVIINIDGKSYYGSHITHDENYAMDISSLVNEATPLNN